MPQIDRHKNRTVPIEFITFEDFERLPYPDRFTLTVVTAGAVRGMLNGRPMALCAPGVLCLSVKDRLQVFEAQGAAAQSFCFHPDFLNTAPFLEERDAPFPTGLKIETGTSLFQGAHHGAGLPHITEKAYPQLFEWFFVLGMEVYAQSDARWVCRVKKYLIQITGLLEDLSNRSGHSPVELALEYIHTNYTDKITLGDLTACAHLNRVSLNQLFQERCGCTAMGYLQSHRLKVAEDLLTHTGMSLSEIARSTGFAYDTYFIKQFTSKRGMPPTAFRNTSRQMARKEHRK